MYPPNGPFLCTQPCVPSEKEYRAGVPKWEPRLFLACSVLSKEHRQPKLLTTIRAALNLLAIGFTARLIVEERQKADVLPFAPHLAKDTVTTFATQRGLCQPHLYHLLIVVRAPRLASSDEFSMKVGIQPGRGILSFAGEPRPFHWGSVGLRRVA